MRFTLSEFEHRFVLPQGAYTRFDSCSTLRGTSPDGIGDIGQWRVRAQRSVAWRGVAAGGGGGCGRTRRGARGYLIDQRTIISRQPIRCCFAVGE